MTIENVITIFVLSLYSFSFLSFKCMAIFQQCSYREKEFLPIIFKSKSGEIWRLSAYSAVFCVFIILLSLAKDCSATTFSYSYFIINVAFCGVYYLTEVVIKRARLTIRYLRIFIVACVIYGACSVLIFKALWGVRLLVENVFLIALSLMPVFIPFIICFSKILNFPYDKLRYEISKAICKKRIAKNKKLITIGITGSFAKTSVKNYLAKMLSTKYRVLSTPKSYNTPLGICKAIKGKIDNAEVFIAEMGARYLGDIKELCKMVKPKVGVITGIAEQHTQTLGNIENVKIAKNRLIEALPKDGFAVFSMQTPYSMQMYNQAKVTKFAVGKEKNCFVSYANFKQEQNGIDFEIVVGQKTYSVFAPLLGEHNAINICLAVAVSLNLGVEIEKILSAIPLLEAVEHRAKLINSSRGIMVIDDGYNANLDGIRLTSQAVDAFSGFKIAVSSGIVEIGKNTQRVNVEVGKILAEHFNLIVAVGVNSNYIKQGACALNAEVICVGLTEETKNIISERAKSGDVVAFFNDLPDRY